jgi:hypothetical protein
MRTPLLALALLAAALGGYALAGKEEREPGAWRAVVVNSYQTGRRLEQNDFEEVPLVTGALNQLHAQGYAVVTAVERPDGSLLLLARR